MAHDLVIRGGTLIDGSGAPGATGDIAIDADRLTQVGGRAGAGREEINADGLVVSPGFVDPHTHYDAQICWDPALTPSCWNGITSVVMGNCGFTVAPCRPDKRDTIMRMLERVEGMSLEALRAGIDWTWETFPEYLDALESLQPALNVGGLVGHSAVRYWAMGDEATEREASDAEVQQMRELVREAMAAGALGFSTSQAPTHLGGDGRPVPSRLASDDEIVQLAEVMREFGRGTFEITAKKLEDVRVSLEASRRSGRPATLLGQVKKEDWKLIHEAREDGVQVVPQTTCRPFLMDFRLDEMGLFDQLPSWSQVAQSSGEGLVRIFGDRDWRGRFREDVTGDFDGMRLFKNDWENISVLIGEGPEARGLVGRSIQDIARERGADPFDAFFDIALADGLRTQFSYMMSTDESRRHTLTDDAYLLGLSDAGAHLTLLADHSYTTYFLGSWIRDRQLMSLEDGVRKLTRDPARFFGVPERGELRQGWFADVTIFDAGTVGAHKPELVYDLPGGGPRLVTHCDGIEKVIVNGQITVDRGELTGSRSGQVIRGA